MDIKYEHLRLCIVELCAHMLMTNDYTCRDAVFLMKRKYELDEDTAEWINLIDEKVRLMEG